MVHGTDLNQVNVLLRFKITTTAAQLWLPLGDQVMLGAE